MIIKTPAITVAVVTLSAMLGSTDVRAQESCPAMYSQMMGIYQADPYSPTYAGMLAYYNSQCLAGASYQSPQLSPHPIYSQYQQPAPYSYGVPLVNPNAAILGAAILGGAVAANSDYRGRHHWEDRRWYRY
jgi:hypothetical protein